MIDFDAPPLKNVLEILMRGLDIKALPKPRALKSDAEKFLRTRSIAEVFTPSRVVKFMVDALDDGKIDSTWLEIACGEAPFITNRYDAESGEIIPYGERTGILDRKLRNAKNLSEAKRAVQTVYGYELQGDSLLIARANVLLTFAEAVQNFSDADLIEVAEIITKNFWRDDGLKNFPAQASLFDDYKFFGGNAMKFDFVIGNPPYNEETADTSDKPVYNFFMEAAYQVGEKVELITPARFLFNAGKTPKDFNRRMLNDEHFKVLDYAPDARKYFKGVDIEGGVAITLRDETKNFGAIGTFTRFEELNSIHKKVVLDNPKFRSINEQIFAQSKWNLETLYKDHPECKTLIGSGGNERRLTTGIFESVKIFREREQDGDVKILGLIKNRRVFRYVEEKYIDTQHENLYKYKVFVPKANGSGTIGSTESTPLIGKPVLGEPLEGSTQTFIGVGAFDTEAEAQACLKYIKSKFARAMLGILKITQDNTADKWAKVPLQDFTSASDIDWSGNVDAQLYKKYGLDASEVEFIERHVKEMI